MELADAEVPVVEAAPALVRRFGCSPLQTRRYLEYAAGGAVVVPEPMVVFPVEVPAALADRATCGRARVSFGQSRPWWRR
ncbi:hypothetical protein ACQP2U_23090 [Nocardia sp. CA-084685]|uniref:hypothetical protein n=1 Tax=Nocardia sp. CA-084685 TaxID=3239970 RepID=UPI003D995EE0